MYDNYKHKILVLYGGNSFEREVSIMTAKKVLSIIDKKIYNVIDMEISNDKNISCREKKWIYDIIDINPDLVFIALHGSIGENGAIQGLLECLNIPYIGSNIMTSSICMNKFITKSIMRYNYIPVTDDIILYKNKSYKIYIDEILRIGFPLIVKPNNGGSSIGVSVVNNKNELIKAINYIIDILNDDVIIEKFIYGKEITCVVYENNDNLNIASIMDIETESKFYNYNEKYESEKSFIDISSLPNYMQDMIKKIAKKVFNIFNAKDYACIDMIISEEQIYVIEINTLPGMTEKSLLTNSFESISDLNSEIKNFSEFINTIIKNNLSKV